MEIYSLDIKVRDHVNHIRREPRSGMVTRKLWIMIKLEEREVGVEKDCKKGKGRGEWERYGLREEEFELPRFGETGLLIASLNK